jgi:hypothetical protein
MLRFEIVDLDRKYNLGVYEDYKNVKVDDARGLAKDVYKHVEHPLYNVDQFALEPIMYCYLQTITNAARADDSALTIHYMPVFLGLIGLLKESARATSLFQSALDTIIAIASENPLKVYLLPLSRIFRWFSIWPHQIEFPENVILLSIERYMPNKNVICVPYPSNYYYTTQLEVATQQLAQTEAIKSRKACFFGRPRRDDHIRSQIISLLDDSKDTDCVSSFDAEGRLHLLAERSVRSLVDLRTRTWISVEPPGDSPSRKGIFDALLGFSLPMLFESGRYDFPFARFFPWEKICFFIYGSDEWRILNRRRSFDQLLSEIPERAIRDRISLLGRYVTYLQYTNPMERPAGVKDAFFAIEVEVESLMRSRLSFGS